MAGGAQGHAGSQEGEVGRLHSQVSSLSEQLHAVQAASAASQQEAHHLKHKQQVHTYQSRVLQVNHD